MANDIGVMQQVGRPTWKEFQQRSYGVASVAAARGRETLECGRLSLVKII